VLSETVEALNMNPVETGDSESEAALAGRTKRDSLLTILLQRSMGSSGRMTRIQLPSVHETEWKRDPRCSKTKRPKENCGIDGEWMLAMSDDDVEMETRGY
jgi:hypothetical protein